MIVIPYTSTKPIIEFLEAAKHSVDEALDVAKRIGDGPSLLLAVLLAGLRAWRLVIASPWIEDLVFHLPQPLAGYLGTDARITLTRLINEYTARNVEVEVYTRTHRTDVFSESSIKRTSFIANLPRQVKLHQADIIHSKYIEAHYENRGLRLVMTCNLEEPEVLKLRIKHHGAEANTLTLTTTP